MLVVFQFMFVEHEHGEVLESNQVDLLHAYMVTRRM